MTLPLNLKKNPNPRPPQAPPYNKTQEQARRAKRDWIPEDPEPEDEPLARQDYADAEGDRLHDEMRDDGEL